MAIGLGLGSIIGAASPHLANLIGKPQFGNSLSGGAGSLVTSLAGSFPIGFLGGAGYGSGLRFGFEKLFDSAFKNIKNPLETVKIMQGGFDIGQSFALPEASATPELGSDLTNPIINPPDAPLPVLGPVQPPKEKIYNISIFNRPLGIDETFTGTLTEFETNVQQLFNGTTQLPPGRTLDILLEKIRQYQHKYKELTGSYLPFQ